MNEYLNKIRRILIECQKHSYRMALAHHEMAHLIPLDVSTVDALSDADIKTVDQFLFRFAKLQDTIGKKLFKTTLLALGEDIEGMSFIDLLNLLEKLNLIYDVEGWFELRRLRNELAHEYEDDKETISEGINAVHQSADKLKSYFITIQAKMEERLNEIGLSVEG